MSIQVSEQYKKRNIYKLSTWPVRAHSCCLQPLLVVCHSKQQFSEIQACNPEVLSFSTIMPFLVASALQLQTQKQPTKGPHFAANKDSHGLC
jgi:hypothetical protein